MAMEIRRRDLITLAAGAATLPVAGPLAARAQQVKRVGVLMNGVPRPLSNSYLTTFVEGLRKLGWIDGQNLRIETRWSAADVKLIHDYADELVRWKPDVLLVASSANLAAVQRTTSTIPIVFTVVSDPVAQGFVPNLVHPGANITGFGEDESPIAAKWLDLLKQMAPGLVRAALVFNPEIRSAIHGIPERHQGRGSIPAHRGGGAAGPRYCRHRACHRRFFTTAERRSDLFNRQLPYSARQADR